MIHIITNSFPDTDKKHRKAERRPKARRNFLSLNLHLQRNIYRLYQIVEHRVDMTVGLLSFKNYCQSCYSFLTLSFHSHWLEKLSSFQRTFKAKKGSKEKKILLRHFFPCRLSSHFVSVFIFE